VIPYLRPLDPFPPVGSAREDMGGLLAVGGSLAPERILDAYCRGIFPWGTVDGQPLWYSPDPRMVLFPQEFRLTRSLAKTVRSGKFEVRFDTDFRGVIARCAETPRPGQNGTWITDDMNDAYVRLHELGWAHSVETYAAGELVGRSRHLPRLVPAQLEGRPHRLPRTRVLRRYERPRGRAHRSGLETPPLPVQRRCGRHGAPRPPRQLSGHRQFLHHDRV
jgi:hypothetical protein